MENIDHGRGYLGARYAFEGEEELPKQAGRVGEEGRTVVIREEPRKRRFGG
jgi:hypothetical protein